MADAQYGVTKVHGYVSTGYETLSSNFEFITIVTAVDIRTATQSGGTPESQANLDKLIQIVSLRGQPVIMGNVASNGTYSLMLTIEHPAAWQCTATDPFPAPPATAVWPGSTPPATALNLPWPDARYNEDLVARIKLDGINFGFGADMTASGGVDDSTTLAVTFSNVLT